MIRSMIRRIDALFYETRITTTTTITRRYYGQDVCDLIRMDFAARGEVLPIGEPAHTSSVETPETLADALIDTTMIAEEVKLNIVKSDIEPSSEDITQKSSTIVYHSTHFEVADRIIPFADVVQQHPPLVIEGINKSLDFPCIPNTAILTSYTSDSSTLAMFNDVVVNEIVFEGHYSRSVVLKLHASYIDAIQTSDDVTTAKAEYSDFIICFSRSSDWGHLSVVDHEGTIVQISQTNVDLFDQDVDCATMAHYYARYFLRTYGLRNDISGYSEEDLVTTIFALMIAERV